MDIHSLTPIERHLLLMRQISFDTANQSYDSDSLIQSWKKLESCRQLICRRAIKRAV